jgi:hypothetical protein
MYRCQTTEIGQTRFEWRIMFAEKWGKKILFLAKLSLQRNFVRKRQQWHKACCSGYN